MRRVTERTIAAMHARGHLAVAAALLLTACSSAPDASEPDPSGTGTPPSSSAATDPVGDATSPLDAEPLGTYEAAEPTSSIGCLDEGFTYLAVPDDSRAFALQTGEGEVGIVLGHQSNAYPCQWAPEALRLADAGYAVIIPNLQLREALGSMLTAEQHLRAEGAEEVVLVGASMGGLFAIAAAATVETPPVGVIALSPPVAYRRVDAHDAAAQVEAPVLIEVGTRDGDLPERAAEIAALLPAPPQLLELDAGEHGVPLLEHTEAREAFDAFLAEVAPVG